MIIERTKKEVIIRLSSKINVDELQELANFFRYKEITSTYSTKQEDVNSVASDINQSWYKANRDKFMK